MDRQTKMSLLFKRQQTSAQPAFHGPVILFQDIIEILHGLEFSSRTPSALSSAIGRRIRSVLVGTDYSRRRMVLSAQRFGEEALSGVYVAFSRQKEVDRRTGGVHSPV
jgi:hypothetical protein